MFYKNQNKIFIIAAALIAGAAIGVFIFSAIQTQKSNGSTITQNVNGELIFNQESGYAYFSGWDIVESVKPVSNSLYELHVKRYNNDSQNFEDAHYIIDSSAINLTTMNDSNGLIVTQDQAEEYIISLYSQLHSTTEEIRTGYGNIVDQGIEELNNATP